MALHDLQDVAFPRFDDAEMERLQRCTHATLKHYPDNRKLIEAGQRNFNFYVVKTGQLDVRDDAADPPKSIAVLGPGEFTGDVAQLTGTPSIVSIVTRGECDLYEVSPDNIRQTLNRCPDLGDLLLQAFIARRHLLREPGNFNGIRVIGSRHSRDTLRIREFLTRNEIPYAWIDLESDPQVDQILPQFGVKPQETPVVAWGRRLILRNPSDRELAEALGLRQPVEQTVYDLAIIGAGPAGLSAAVYAASEGLNTVVPERTAPGGQAGRSMRIENYPGFPIGMTGAALAERAYVQAIKFGAHLPVATIVTGVSFDNRYSVMQLDDGTTLKAKCMIICTGADYRRLGVENCESFEGCGVYYAATPTEAQLCRDSEVLVVGGGNSAGQAAVYLAGNTRKVYLVVRTPSLEKDMSAYLVRRIEQMPNVEALLDTVVQRLFGEQCLSAIEVVNTRTGQVRKIHTPALFSFIGATPRTDWLPPEIEKDAKGFIRTGQDVAQSPRWTAHRPPYFLETTHPGVFAAGDVRSGSIKRCASAVGEGAMAVQFVHEYLKGM